MDAHAAVMRAHCLPTNTSVQGPHTNMPGSHTQKTTPGLTQTHGYVHTRREEYKCIGKSHTHNNRSRCAQTHLPHHKRAPPSTPHSPRPSILAKQGPGLPHQLHPLPGSRQTLPCLPRPARVGPCPLPAPAASSAWGRVPSGAGCGSGMLPAPPPPPRPATSASGPQPGLHLAHFCRQWAGRPIPSVGGQEEGPAGKTPGRRDSPWRASHHHPWPLLHLWTDPAHQCWVSTLIGDFLSALANPPRATTYAYCPLPHRHLALHTAFPAHTHDQRSSRCPTARSPAHTATQSCSPSTSQPVSQHHQAHKTLITHTGPRAVSVKRTQSQTVPCAGAATQTCRASLGVQNCPKQSCQRCPGGAGGRGQVSVPPSMFTVPGHWGGLHFIPSLSLFWSYASLAGAEGWDVTPEAMPSHRLASGHGEEKQKWSTDDLSREP